MQLTANHATAYINRNTDGALWFTTRNSILPQCEKHNPIHPFITSYHQSAAHHSPLVVVMYEFPSSTGTQECNFM